MHEQRDEQVTAPNAGGIAEPIIASMEPVSVIVRVVAAADPARRGQGYGLIRTYQVITSGATSGQRPTMIRIDIERNARDSQSHYLASILTDSGWKVVHSILPESYDMAALPPYVAWNANDHHECVAAVEAVADRLVAETCELLRGC